MRVLIADDEPVVREGLRAIIDWKKLGFTVCGEAGTGTECLQKMLSLSPDLVLLDIKMPLMHGLDVAQKAKQQGFRGRIIVISGYSSFQYAQTAIQFGVNYYLLKPIDEEELENAVRSIKKDIELEQQKSVHVSQYIEKAKDSILCDIIKGKAPFAEGFSSKSEGDVYGIKLYADSYRVIIADTDDYDETNPHDLLPKLFRLSHSEIGFIEPVRIHDRSVYLLKGSMIIEKIMELTPETNRRAEEFHEQGIFSAQGRIAYSQQEIHVSYEDAKQLLKRRFFYPREMCFVSEPDQRGEDFYNEMINDIDTKNTIDKIVSLVEACNADKACETLDELCSKLYHINTQPADIKSFLSSVFIQVKRALLVNFKQLDASFESDAAIISAIRSATRLYEITDYLNTKIGYIITAIGNYSRDHVIDKVIHYINKNYDKNLKLETLAELFCYNSAYLGKVFKNNVGESFNYYLDRVRITNAKEMLKQENIKVYEISERIGYNNIDYFYKKFKKYVGESPSEYRKKLGIITDTNSD